MDDHNNELETLGEQLYSLIYPTHKENAGKLTGMLLELPVPVLSQMVQEEAMLTAALEKALRALELKQEPRYSRGLPDLVSSLHHTEKTALRRKVQCKDEVDVAVSSESLGEQLFELVDAYNTGHSQKITGMILEQHKETVLNLLSDPKLLEEQVNYALKTLKEQSAEETDISDSSDTDDSERLGEKLFSLVEALDPLHANDITGMLLEMEPAGLQQLLRDHTMLEVAVQKAQAALDT